MPELTGEFVWMADAPLFIDSNQVEHFHDAVVQPDAEIISETETLTEEQVQKIKGKIDAELSVEPGALASLIAPVFAFFKPKAKVAAGVEAERDSTSGSQRTTQTRPIVTAERLLVELAIHYLVNKTERLFLVDNPSSTEWRSEDSVASIPRALAFLNLKKGTKLIPAVAEFTDGSIQLLYDKIRGRDGSGPPGYPERPKMDNEGNEVTSLQDLRKDYWHWFAENFSATQAMLIVEKAASQHGRIRWIDYRLPVTDEGDSLHLHVCPAGEFDTGVFAYNMIKRGYKHGLRLVGTLKSEPDMNVLAIYEK